MKREIAAFAGNFRGVCPALRMRTIGRMSFFPYTGVYRPTESGRPKAGLFFGRGLIRTDACMKKFAVPMDVLKDA